jgi:hypothetical protein
LGAVGPPKSAIQRHLSTALWNWVVRPVLMVPALPAFVVLGLLFLWLGNRSSASPEADYLTGSRPSRLRRRRNRGGLS